MIEGGFLTPNRPRPLGMAVVIALHAGVLAALLLAKGELIPPRNPVMVGENIPLPKPPPPQPPIRAAKQMPTHESTVPTQVVVDLPPIGETPVIIDLKPVQFPSGDTFGRASDGAAKAVPPVVVGAEIDPRFARDFQPAYPSSAQRDGIEGKATVRVRIGADGRVKAVEMVSATDRSFFEATERQALRRWRFTPARRDGAAVESVKVMTVTFVLQNG